ncbi:MAG: ribosome small subunit-dependent GTPase A [Candidatus Melainabacteria bacterium RIFCSPHIGHO2_02_FULL_34_12]|nr:MAG: ribosome small subunit-dependent GTPase A [Candidatus Melainabacteria bacterium RIFCSPHIGHO2_02_FULL_34_12]
MKLIGKITKILANFYYVQDKENKTWECFARARLLKEGKLLYVGDDVEIETTSDKQGVITDLKERKNKIDKPQAANIDQVLVVFSTFEPEFDFYNLDRYLSYISYELPDERVRICINKTDLKKINIDNTYRNSTYDISYISALTGQGVNELSSEIVNRVSVLAGPSGVGKSSLIKALVPALDIRIGRISSIKQGTHQTRNIELVSVKGSYGEGFLIDTPGFAQFSFGGLDPYKVLQTFKEFSDTECEFSNCLHYGEDGCSIPDLVNSNKIPETRYESYKKIMDEVHSEIVYGSKKESKSKSIGGKEKTKYKVLPKIDPGKRTKSRKQEKQELLRLDEESD